MTVTSGDSRLTSDKRLNYRNNQYYFIFVRSSVSTSKSMTLIKATETNKSICMMFRKLVDGTQEYDGVPVLR